MPREQILFHAGRSMPRLAPTLFANCKLERRALVTRNKQEAVDIFHKTHFDLSPFCPALTREFLPYKVTGLISVLVA